MARASDGEYGSELIIGFDDERHVFFRRISAKHEFTRQCLRVLRVYSQRGFVLHSIISFELYDASHWTADVLVSVIVCQCA